MIMNREELFGTIMSKIRFWTKKPVYKAAVFCNICGKDLTGRDKIYWVDSYYCTICYQKQSVFGEGLK